MLTGISASVYRYVPHREDDGALRQRLRELASQRKRFGSPRLHIMLKREHLVMNHKRTERLYREEGLSLRRKRRRKGAAGVRVVLEDPHRAKPGVEHGLHDRFPGHRSEVPGPGHTG